MILLLCFLMLAVQPAQALDSATGKDSEVVSGIFSPFGIGPTIISSSDDADFIAAHDAFLAGDAKKLAFYAQRLKKSPLEVYVSYYQLRLNLENASPGEVTAFLSRPDDTPVIDQLRKEWLKILGKTRQWELFDSEYPRLLNKEIELVCYDLQSHSRSSYLLALRNASR